VHFELPGELSAFALSLRDLARAELSCGALQRAHAPGFPRDVVQFFAAQSLTGIVAAPAQGRPHGVLAGALAVETVARVCPRGADAMHQGSFAAALHLARYGTSRRHRDELQAVLNGQRLLSIAVSEEGAGSQAAALSTRVAPSRGGVVVNGSKRFTANSADADGFIVYAAFGDTILDVGAVIVDAADEGLVRGPESKFMTGETWRALTFTDLFVPRDAVLFSSGGFGEHAGFFDVEKIGNAARALGLGWCAFDIARAHAAERRQFGKALSEFQGLQWRFADARLGLESAQLTLYRAASRADSGTLRGEDSSCAKLACNRAAYAACDLAVQTLGGLGYSQDGLVEYCFRKARGHLINGGVAELMLTRIAEGVFGCKFPQQAH
jgi:alkylation response protein AidB-like acyl-CoA dehydrogenase